MLNLLPERAEPARLCYGCHRPGATVLVQGSAKGPCVGQHSAGSMRPGCAQGAGPASCQLRFGHQSSGALRGSACSARPRAARLVRLVRSAMGPRTWLLQSRFCYCWDCLAARRTVWCLQVVRARDCAEDGCSRRARYNFEGSFPLFCRDHKDADMVLPRPEQRV